MEFASIPEIDTPALVIDLDAHERNLRRVADYFAARPCDLRPHVKTHKCSTIARRQVEMGAIGVTCAKVGEAEAMADGGITSILIANQVTAASKIQRLAALAGRCELMVALDDVNNARAIGQAATQAGTTVGVLVEIDTGMRRCGLAPDPAQAVAFAKAVLPVDGLRFRGLMGYEGHTVMIEDDAERRAKASEAGRQLGACAQAVRDAGIDVQIVSGGGTGTYDISGDSGVFTEIQAGSYVFMDARYHGIQPELETALFMVSTVVSLARGDLVTLDCGMKSLTHEFGQPPVVSPSGLGPVGLSEEHGRCAIEGGTCDLKLGDQVWLLPTHCCTTANLHDRYWCVRDGRLVGTWAIDARGRFD